MIKEDKEYLTFLYVYIVICVGAGGGWSETSESVDFPTWKKKREKCLPEYL